MNIAIKITLGMLTALTVAAADFPTKPVRLIVPYPPGGGNDTISRLLAPKFTESTGQSSSSTTGPVRARR